MTHQMSKNEAWATALAYIQYPDRWDCSVDTAFELANSFGLFDRPGVFLEKSTLGGWVVATERQDLGWADTPQNAILNAITWLYAFEKEND